MFGDTKYAVKTLTNGQSCSVRGGKVCGIHRGDCCTLLRDCSLSNEGDE